MWTRPEACLIEGKPKVVRLDFSRDIWRPDYLARMMAASAQDQVSSQIMLEREQGRMGGGSWPMRR